MPFLVRGPGIESSSRCDVPVVGYDLLPTFYKLAGGSASLTKEIDGGSFDSLLNKPDGEGTVKRPLDAIVFHRPDKRMSAIRQKDHKLFIRYGESGSAQSSELYNVRTDIGESKDVSEVNPQRTEELHAMLNGYLKRVGAKEARAKKKRKKDQ